MKRRNAFTLIELLVVVAIVAILAAMLVGAVRKVRSKMSGQSGSEPYSQRESQSGPSTQPDQFQVGETVYVKSLDITGTVNAVYAGNYVDLIVKDSSGNLKTMERINGTLLSKTK